MVNNEVYGGAIQISPQLLMELLKIKGELVHVESDPISKSLVLHVKGGAGEFPKVAEGSRAPRMKAEYLCTNVGDVPIVNRVTLVNVEDGSEFIHYNECDSCHNGTHLIRISDGEGQISKISYTQPRACLGSPQCRYRIETKEPVIIEETKHCGMCKEGEAGNEEFPRYTKGKLRSCPYNNYLSCAKTISCLKCDVYLGAKTEMTLSKETCRYFSNITCTKNFECASCDTAKERIKIEEGKKGVETKWYCPFSPANLCGKADCKNCDKFKDWKRLCGNCDGYSKEHLGEERPKNTCYESSKCKFRSHMKEGFNQDELVKAVEESEEPIILLPNCRFYPQSWSCSFSEKDCETCHLKCTADSDMCKTCGVDHGHCDLYGKGGCKITPKYLALQGDEKKNETSEKENKGDRICSYTKESCGHTELGNKGLCHTCEEFKKVNEKKLYYCSYKKDICTQPREDGCTRCYYKIKALEKEFPCPYNPNCICDISKDEVGGLKCINCGERKTTEQA